MRILVLVLSYDREPWRTIERDGQRATWGSVDDPELSVLYYYGLHRGPAYWASRIASKALRTARVRRAHSAFARRVGEWSSERPVRRDGTRLLTGVPESYGNTNAKLRAALRYALVSDPFDFLFRTNTSSYVDVERLRAMVAALPREGLYGGFLGERNGLRFASGTGILMSRDVARIAATDPEWDFDEIDDVAVGGVMRRAGVQPRPLPRGDASEGLTVADLEGLRGCHLVRCRVAARQSRHRSGARREASEEAALMRRVHSALINGGRGRADGG